MSYNSRRVLTPGISRKRKMREDQPFYYSSLKPASSPGQVKTTTKGVEPVCSNQLVAGYMANEFLTKGTLFGQKFDPARAEAVPVGVNSVEPRRAEQVKEHTSYAEVATILKTDGAHIPGIVNPTQLARWIEM